MNNKTKIIGLSTILMLVSIIIFVLFYPSVNPHYSIYPKISKDSIIVIAKENLRKLNIANPNFFVELKLRNNSSLITQTQQKFGLKKGNELLRNKIAAYFWDVKINDSDARLNLMTNNKEKLVKSIIGNINLKYNLSGNLIGLDSQIPDTLKLPAISFDEAYNIASNFLVEFTPYKDLVLDTISISNQTNNNKSYTYSLGTNREKNETKAETETRTDYKFSASTFNKILNNKILISVGVTGNLISSFKVEETIPEIFTEGDSVVTAITSAIIYAILMIILIVLAFRRYRAYEIGFKLSVVVGILVGLGVVYNITMETEVFSWEILFPIVFGFLFSAAGVAIAWAVSESLTREIWKDKLTSVDLLYNGYFFHSKIGKSILRGLGFGFALLAFWTVLISLINIVFNISIISSSDEASIFNNSYHILFAIISSLNHVLFPSIMVFLFLGAFIRSRIKSNKLLVVFIGIIWGILMCGKLNPFYIGISVQFVMGIFFAYIFLKFDYLTTLISLIVFYFLYLGISLFYLPVEINSYSSYTLIAVILILFIFAIFSLFSKKRIKDLEEITPAFAKHISERQRMQSELQVARDVQMSFLPQKSPDFSGIDISAKCIPAYEVGGDYYDFININEKRFGIAIGDVSGKGTKAAFYMTLTKGFLKATSRFYVSPAAILSNMNNMFYENVERGSFISMIYADVDIENNKLIMARAGHNPLIGRKTNSGIVENYKPGGIALGLEKGDIFAKTITEQIIPFNTGDVFVFYTDGITEAENNKKEEYGENRLLEIIKNSDDLNSKAIMELILDDVHKFTGKTPQHDDMTLIVLKIE
ncbi:MAG: PP2C family protein-serine/threonine phosphatase [bacterium]